MHFSVLLFHEWDSDSIMQKYSYEASEDEGADIEFNVEMTKKEAEKEYKSAIGKKGAYTKEDYPTLEDYMEAEYSHLDKDNVGNYGSNSNSYGMYDWYSVGGRWSGCLPSCRSEKELKALLKKALNLKNKEVAEKYRDKAEEYVKISEMPLREACAYLQVGGTSSLAIGEVPAQTIIDWFRSIEARWDGHDIKEDAVHSIINTIIIETEDEMERFYDGDENINEEFFKEKYEYYLKLGKKEGREFFLTILDFHT